MAIKFRCSHCQQFLGIAEAKAGELVDCPGCGRTVRVPRTSGTSEPAPAPQIDFSDEELSGALQQLQSFEAAPSSEAVVIVPTAVPVTDPGTPPPAVVVENSEATQTAEAQPVKPPPVVHETDERPDAEVLSELAAQHRAAPAAVEAEERSPIGLWWAIAGAILLAFAVGVGLGRQSTGSSKQNASEATPVKVEQVAVKGEDPSRIAGLVNFQSGQGVQPDRGARILLLPDPHPGTARLPVAGLRNGAESVDVAMTRAAVQAAGGDFALADESGRYSLTAPEAGQYHLLIVSAHQSVDDEQPLLDVLPGLESWVEPPHRFVGRLQWELRHLRIDEADREVSHEFAQPEASP